MTNPSIPAVTFFRKRMTRRRVAAFSLVEVALALGIVAFAMVPLVGLLPIGMQASSQALDQTITAQIVQRLANLIQQTDYSKYADLQADCYYFDNQGQPIVKVASGTPQIQSVYSAAILTPPASGTSSLVNSSTVATLQIQIVNDPNHSLTTPQTALTPALKLHAVMIPVYLANNGN